MCIECTKQVQNRPKEFGQILIECIAIITYSYESFEG